MGPSSETAAGHATSAAATKQHMPPPRPPGDGESAPGGDGESAPGGDGGTRHRWSHTSVGLLAATAVVLASALLTHVGMIFLTLAPTNVLTVRDQALVRSYIQPEFGQSWKLFAPNPKQRNDSIGVRLRTTSPRGVRRISEWINLTDQDVAAIKGDPAPSHVNQNMLRIAWDNSEAWHGSGDRPKGVRGVVAGAYLKRIVLQRVGRRWRGEPITAVQIAGRYTKVPPPSWTGEEKPDTTTYRVLPWWPVTDQDYKGL